MFAAISLSRWLVYGCAGAWVGQLLHVYRKGLFCCGRWLGGLHGARHRHAHSCVMCGDADPSPHSAHTHSHSLSLSFSGSFICGNENDGTLFCFKQFVHSTAGWLADRQTHSIVQCTVAVIVKRLSRHFPSSHRVQSVAHIDRLPSPGSQSCMFVISACITPSSYWFRPLL